MDILYRIAELRCAPLDYLFRFFTLFGEELVVMAALCTILWCVDKRLAYRFGFAYFISGMAVQTLKITFRIERPWIIDPNFKPVGGAMLTATGYSFPSGHTQSATALWGTLGFAEKRKWLKILMFCMIPCVALSRLYLGVHTPLDVIGAFAVTAFITAGLYWPLKKLGDTEAARWFIPTALILISSAAAAYSFYLIGEAVVPLSEGADCLKGAGAGIGFAIGYYIERKYLNYDENLGTPYLKVLKLSVGIAAAVVLKVGLKHLLGSSGSADLIRYLILALWVAAIYPALFTRLKCFQKA
jgi:Membrane-associated phospholipid phosphatase